MVIYLSIFLSLITTYLLIKSKDIILKEKIPKINLYDVKFLRYIHKNIVIPFILLLIIYLFIKKYIENLIYLFYQPNKLLFFFILLLPIFLLYLIKINKIYKQLFPKKEIKEIKEDEKLFLFYNLIILILFYILIVLLLTFINLKIMQVYI